MYDLEKEMKKFYYNEVVLPQDETTNLREKKKINLDRLKEGLKEYNEEKKTDYKIAETIEQGSVAMSTVIQNDKNDYDIDVAIVFDDTNIGEIGPIAIKNIIVDALKRKCSNFKKEPEAKTNCVRIEYVDNYHIDFAIYKRIKNEYNDGYKYEHAGSEWRTRDPRAINNWFKEEIRINGEKLRQAIRLSKTFCKSRESWNMPGGLIQTVLCDEKIQNYSRIDEMFYYTICEIRDRLEYNKEVYNPTDSTQSLLLVEEDRTKLENLYNRLNTYISELDVLFETDCTEKQAKDAWYSFFNHDYWNTALNESARSLSITYSYSKNIYEYDDTEEFIENMYPAQLTTCFVEIDCKVTNKDGQVKYLSDILNKNEKIEIGCDLDFFIKNINAPDSYEVLWKVKNEGILAEKQNCIRGQIFKSKQNLINHETSNFAGNHYVECYIIKNSICIAKKRIEVPIK